METTKEEGRQAHDFDGKNAIFHPLMKVPCRMTALLGLFCFFSPGLLLSATLLSVLFAAAAATAALLRA